MSDVDVAVTILRDFGLPVTMLAWFAFRLERILTDNTDAIEQLRLAVVAHMESQARLARQHKGD